MAAGECTHARHSVSTLTTLHASALHSISTWAPLTTCASAARRTLSRERPVAVASAFIRVASPMPSSVPSCAAATCSLGTARPWALHALAQGTFLRKQLHSSRWSTRSTIDMQACARRRSGEHQAHGAETNHARHMWTNPRARGQESAARLVDAQVHRGQQVVGRGGQDGAEGVDEHTRDRVALALGGDALKRGRQEGERHARARRPGRQRGQVEVRVQRGGRHCARAHALHLHGAARPSACVRIRGRRVPATRMSTGRAASAGRSQEPRMGAAAGARRAHITHAA